MQKHSIESAVATALLSSRWLLAPFYIGLLIALALLLVTFGRELVHLLAGIFTMTRNEALVGVLSLIDITLAANLVLIVIFSGHEYYTPRGDTASGSRRVIDFSAIKLKLLASIVAISAIDLLESYLNIESMTELQIKWMVAVFMTFVLSCLVLAVTEWFTQRGKKPD